MCALIAEMMWLYRVNIWWTSAWQLQRKWSSFKNVRYYKAKKQAYFDEYLRTYWTDFHNIFTIWKHFTCRWWIYPYFPICRGTLPWQSIDFGKMSSTPTDTTCILCNIVRKRVQYHCLNVCVNSGDDVAISCKNLVNFCLATPEKMELIWERHVRQGQKTGVFRRISPDILDGFSQYFHHMKTLYLQMMDLYLFSNLSREVAMATK